ncbi:MAG: FimV/HubP family polar landmark protein [Pseudomonadota bacterium]
MYRKSAVTAALFFITTSSNLHALGLGEIDMQSALNQPMDAVIELTSAASTDLSKINVTLASQAAHERIGLSRSRILNEFDFNVEKDRQGNAFVRITSHGAVHEPFLEFLLEITWPKGHLLREYTVLVDPPITMPATPARPVTPVSRAPAPRAVVQPPSRQRQPQARPGPATVHASAPASTISSDSYGPIRRNDTLWSIAERLRPGNDISMHQMMLALQRKNPQAFEDNNINSIKAGAMMNIPSRDEILSVSASEAYKETSQQYSEWKEATQTAAQDESSQETPAVAETDAASESSVTTKSRLQLMAPEGDAVAGSATPGDPAEATGDAGESSTEILNQQLAMAAEEAETSKAQSTELRTQVTELEEQVETMARLLELKDDELASMQQQLAADAAAELAEQAPDEAEPEMSDVTIAAEEATAEDISGEAAAMVETGDDFAGIVNKLMANPLLAGLGALVALLLGGFLWSSTRKRNHSGIFDDEMTLDKHMSAVTGGSEIDRISPVINLNDPEPEQQPESEPANDDSDPVTEADVYLAYGRIQQAEDVLQAALATSPEDTAIRLKLLEVYHAAGNVAAFNREASDFRDGISEEDAAWMQVASMGYALSPGNELYRAAATHTADANVDFDMDLSDMENVADQDRPLDDAANDAPEPDLSKSIEFNLDDAADMLASDDGYDEEDASEGLLNTAEEVTTKLDLARAYLDMGDPEGARSILGEVMEEGNDEQKNEAEALISKLA